MVTTEACLVVVGDECLQPMDSPHLARRQRPCVLNIFRVADSVAPVLTWSLHYGEVFEGVLTLSDGGRL